MLGQVIVWFFDQGTKIAYSCWSVVMTEFRRMISDPSRPGEYEHGQLLEGGHGICARVSRHTDHLSHLPRPPPPEPY